MAALRIGIAGLGTVGGGVVKILQEKSALLSARCGKELKIIAASARKKRDIKGAEWLDDPLALAARSDIDIVVELIGGAEGVANDLVTNSLKNGKSVVTANKALIAKHGLRLATLAEQHNAQLLFEAAVAGGIPIIGALKRNLAGNRFSKISGILNGTCNFILTAMESRELDFQTALKKAQELGYAEADPSFDVGGVDAAHKLAILTSLAFDCPPALDHIYIEGIEKILPSDIHYAHELGYRIRLLGVTEMVDGKISQRVHPALVPDDSPLARVTDVTNAVLVNCDALGPLFIQGAGAGGGATASSVIADLAHLALGTKGATFNIPAAQLKPGNFMAISGHTGAYYLRMAVKDTPGVLAEITHDLSEEKIGVDAVLQPSAKNGKMAEIILITHPTDEASMQRAGEKISDLSALAEPLHLIRVER